MAAFDLSSSITSTSGISVSASGASAYTLSGNDRDGSVSGNNATVNTNVGDILNFVVDASGHPFYIRVSNGGANVSTPAATNQGTQSGTVSWTPNTAGTYYYQCGNHSSMIGTITVSSVPVSSQNGDIEFKPSTATAYVSPTFSSVTYVISNPSSTNHNITDEDPITSSVRGWLIGRRPASGMLYPRGVYNK